MPTPYIYERQSESWMNDQLREFFARLQFEILILPVPQYTESKIPADFIFFDKKRTKLFGFQYKALLHNGGDYWIIDDVQYKKFKPYPWIYYCLSELKKTVDYKEAIHFARIATQGAIKRFVPQLPYNSEFRTYWRWATFYRAIEKCHKGVLVTSPEHLEQLLRAGEPDNDHLKRLAQQAVDIFLVDFHSRHVVNLVPEGIQDRG